MSTYSTNLRLELIGTGEQQGSWGSTTNINLGTLLEQAIGGYEAITVSNVSDTTLTTANGSTDQARNMTLNLTGTISAARNVICPAIEKLYVIKNATTGGFAVTIKVTGQTGVSIPNGSTVVVYVDGVDARLVSQFPVPVAQGGTGATSSTGTGSVVLSASPTFTGAPISTTAAADTNTTQIATTAYVLGQASALTPIVNGTAAIGTSPKYARADHVHPTDTSRAALASPTFTGIPAAPTAAENTNTTQLATTAYVVAQASSTTPVINGTAAVGTSLKYARADHVHPTDTSRAALASPTFTGTPAAPTAAADTNTTQLATTAYVIGQASSTTPVINGTAAVGTSVKYARADHVHPTDTTRAPLASPALTGTPTAPTAGSGTNTTQLATTAFVQTAVAAAGASNVTVYTSGSGNYTVPNATVFLVRVWGAGGGGAHFVSGVSNAGGGGGGGYTEKYFTLAGLGGAGASVAYAVGAGGSGGSGGTRNGSNGGNTTFGSLTAYGGEGGSGTGGQGAGFIGITGYGAQTAPGSDAAQAFGGSAGGSSAAGGWATYGGAGGGGYASSGSGGTSVYGGAGGAGNSGGSGTAGSAPGGGGGGGNGAGVGGQGGAGRIEVYAW